MYFSGPWGNIIIIRQYLYISYSKLQVMQTKTYLTLPNKSTIYFPSPAEGQPSQSLAIKNMHFLHRMPENYQITKIWKIKPPKYFSALIHLHCFNWAFSWDVVEYVYGFRFLLFLRFPEFRFPEFRFPFGSVVFSFLKCLSNFMIIINILCFNEKLWIRFSSSFILFFCSKNLIRKR